MSLSVAFNAARSSLFSTSSQIETTARNISGAGQAGTSRKLAITTTMGDGGATVISVSRASDNALFTRMLTATSHTADKQALLNGLERLQTTVGDPESDASPAARLGALSDALAQYANMPDDPSIAGEVVVKAQYLATSLNTAADAVHKVRTDADTAMARSVSRVNDLLKQFEVENTTVVRGTAIGADVTDAMDRRDTLLASLAEEMGVTAISRGNNDMLIYTDGGATLFETRPRTVSFTTTPVLTAGMTGRAVMVDGVSVTGDDATMPLRSGRLVGLAELRDRTSVVFENQLDQMAQGLMAAFAEIDHTGGGAPDMPGLFTDGSGTLPATSTGAASRIAVNPAVDSAQGGTLTLLRDGGINGAAYEANATGAASFADEIRRLHTSVLAVRTFDPAAEIGSSASLADFGQASVGWLEGARQAASTKTESEKALLAHASDALSNATGINMDDEYARQLELERSYQASSKLISIINDLYDTLLQAVR